MPEADMSDIKFIQACTPPLDAGEYRMTVQQTVTASGCEKLPASVNYFSVRGPRFALDPADVYSVFPPPNQTGSYGNCLPHIVLNRRTLPWERTLDGTMPRRTANQGGSREVAPWIAVICFSQDEGPEIQNLTVGDFLAPPTGTVAAKLDVDKAAGESEEDPCMVIDVPRDLFLRIMPYKEESSYLAHARYTDMGQKETNGSNTAGWFACVIGNRFPKTSQGGEENIVHVISLEGLGEYLPGGTREIDPSVEYVRLVSLANWRFWAIEEEYNFEQIIKKLSPGQTLRMPAKDHSPALESETVENALNMGYVGLNHSSREGEKTVSWYRGPLVPLSLRKGLAPCYPCADAAVRYDPTTGLFDLSHAAAWQLGRLLALQDKHFAVAIFEWRRRNCQTAMLNRVRSKLSEKLRPVLAHREDHAHRIGDNWARSMALDFLRTALREELFPEDETREPLLGRSADPSGLRERADCVPGIVSEVDFNQALSSSKDIHEAVHSMMLGGECK
jgi:hypothetical protein